MNHLWSDNCSAANPQARGFAMPADRQKMVLELRRGLICALCIATLWAGIYWVMGMSSISAVTAAIAAAAVRFAVLT
jgi:hypothetical protein